MHMRRLLSLWDSPAGALVAHGLHQLRHSDSPVSSRFPQLNHLTHVHQSQRDG